MAKKKILVVDDSELVRTMARNALEEAGYEVVTAEDTLQANNHIFSKRAPDLIVMDVMLPTVSGDRKVKLLRDKEQAKAIPMLLLSSKTEAELTELCAQSGADGFIHKPFTDAEIVSCVGNSLSGNGVRSTLRS